MIFRMLLALESDLFSENDSWTLCRGLQLKKTVALQARRSPILRLI